MKPYGVKRNWNATEDYVKDEQAMSLKAHRRMLKIAHRRERRTVRQLLKLGLNPEEMIGNA